MDFADRFSPLWSLGSLRSVRPPFLQPFPNWLLVFATVRQCSRVRWWFLVRVGLMCCEACTWRFGVFGGICRGVWCVAVRAGSGGCGYRWVGWCWRLAWPVPEVRWGVVVVWVEGAARGLWLRLWFVGGQWAILFLSSDCRDDLYRQGG